MKKASIVCVALLLLVGIMTFLCNYLPSPATIADTRIVILQDGTRIQSSRFRITQWTLTMGVTVNGNDYAGPYKILTGEQE